MTFYTLLLALIGVSIFSKTHRNTRECMWTWSESQKRRPLENPRREWDIGPVMRMNYRNFNEQMKGTGSTRIVCYSEATRTFCSSNRTRTMLRHQWYGWNGGKRKGFRNFVAKSFFRRISQVPFTFPLILRRLREKTFLYLICRDLILHNI